MVVAAHPADTGAATARMQADNPIMSLFMVNNLV
jgi:hypothetical protein